MKYNGGPAFAMPASSAIAIGAEEWNRAQFGMSLRDYFAALAMSKSTMHMPADRAYEAYRIADAMLKERNA